MGRITIDVAALDQARETWRIPDRQSQLSSGLDACWPCPRTTGLKPTPTPSQIEDTETASALLRTAQFNFVTNDQRFFWWSLPNNLFAKMARL
jgi:hypothetical protein